MRLLGCLFALVLLATSLAFFPERASAEVSSCNFTSTHWDSGGRAYETGQASCGYNQTRTFKVSICHDLIGYIDPCNSSSYTQSAYSYSATVNTDGCHINDRNIYVLMWITDTAGNQRSWRTVVHNC